MGSRVKICPKCQERNEETSQVCVKCGASLETCQAVLDWAASSNSFEDKGTLEKKNFSGRNYAAAAMLVLMVCFLLLGLIFQGTAKRQRGVSASTGVVINGQYIEQSSGRLGANREKYEVFHSGGTTFYILGGICGVAGVVLLIKKRKRT